jgi:uncharacterized protein YidB (DUF937 family)
MGLLDDILAQVGGGAQNEPPPRTDAGTTSSGMAPLLTALMPVVLAMLAGNDNRAGSRSSGLGGLLGQVLGGGADTARGGGGLGALLGQLEQAGFGDQVRSWVGTGRNEPIAPSAIERVFGGGALAEIAQRAGVSQTDAANGLSQLMPELVDRMTPNGQLPENAAMLANVEALAKRIGFV